MATSDEALLLEFQRGSRQALEELFARYRGPLGGFFQRRLRCRERADDLTQETFLAVIRATSRYEPRATVRTYLYAIALKLLAAERRRQDRDTGAAGGNAQPANYPARGQVGRVGQAVSPAKLALDGAGGGCLCAAAYGHDTATSATRGRPGLSTLSTTGATTGATLGTGYA